MKFVFRTILAAGLSFAVRRLLTETVDETDQSDC